MATLNSSVPDIVWSSSFAEFTSTAAEDVRVTIQSSSDDMGTPSSEVIFRNESSIIFLVAYAIVIVPAVFGNLFVILAVICHPELRSQHTNIYTVNLAICDLMVVVAECPFVIIQFAVRGDTAAAFFTDAVCKLTFFINGFFGTCSILTMLALGVEKYCAVMHPLQMIGGDAATRARSVIVFFWSFSILTHLGQLAVFGEVKHLRFVDSDGSSFDLTICMSARPEEQPLYSHVYASTVFILIYGSTFCTTLVLYIRILQCLIKRKGMSSDELVEMQNNTAAPNRGISKVRTRASTACTAAVHKTFRLLSCSVLSYLICYSLYFYINLYYIYYGWETKRGAVLILLANWFGALNSLVNPIVHALFVDQLRTVFRGILTGRSWRRRSSRSSSLSVVGGSGARRKSTPESSMTPKPSISTVADSIT